MLMLLSVALAQTPPPPAPAAPAPPPGPPSDVVIRAEVDKAYGKHVPQEAVCIEHPALDAPFRGFPTPVGVKQGSRGCVLFGVMVDGVWLAPEKALPAAVDRAAWDALPAADRTARILQWTDHVLLAYDLPSATLPGKVVAGSKGAFTVERRMFRRSDRSGGATDLTEKSTFDATLTRTAVTQQVHGDFTSNLVTRPESVTGISEAVVDQALTSKGRVIRECFTDLWEVDPTITGRVVMSWTVTAGKVDPVAVVEMPGEVANPELVKCYGRHIRAAAYPPEANGTVRWVFWVDRRELVQ
jgi:hypothetical protein